MRIPEENDLNNVKKLLKEGTNLTVGTSVTSDYLNSCVGLVYIRVFTDLFEYFYIGAIGGSNKYVKNMQKIFDYKYQGNINADCTIQLYDSPDTVSYHVQITNTGSVDLKYTMCIINGV